MMYINDTEGQMENRQMDGSIDRQILGDRERAPNQQKNLDNLGCNQEKRHNMIPGTMISITEIQHDIANL